MESPSAMTKTFDFQTLWFLGGVIALLCVSSLIGWVLSRRTGTPGYQVTVANLNARIRAWWLMTLIFVVAMAIGKIGAVILFGLISFLALREFITMTPTKPGDHRSLFWVFFVITPIQYLLIAWNWYGL